jgi:hypothetical protein
VTFDLAAGEYALDVSTYSVRRGSADADCFWHAVDRTIVKLAPGERTDVVLDARVGGHVRLHLDWPGRDRYVRGRERAQVQESADPFLEERSLRRRHPSNPPGTIVRDEGDGSVLRLRPSDAPVLSSVPSGPCVTAQALTPGPHVLTIRAPGFETETVRVVVEPRSFVDAHVTLRREP